MSRIVESGLKILRSQNVTLDTDENSDKPHGFGLSSSDPASNRTRRQDPIRDNVGTKSGSSRDQVETGYMNHEIHEKIIFKDEVYAVQGAIFDVYREMGCGFLEGVYSAIIPKHKLKE
jgi:hypothetical protein